MVFKSVPSGSAHETDIVCVNGSKAYRLHLVRGHDLPNILRQFCEVKNVLPK